MRQSLFAVVRYSIHHLCSIVCDSLLWVKDDLSLESLR